MKSLLIPRNRVLCIALQTSLCTAVAAPVHAQSVPSSGPGEASQLEEIIVTAQKRSQSTQDIGLSIAAFGSKQLDALGVEEVRDLVAVIPGLTVANSFRGPPIYTLRGVGFNTPNMSTSSPVGIYMDEIAYPYPVMSDGLAFDLERIEVLKGPQGTLYGRNTTGGLVNSIANKPTRDLGAKVEVSYGSYDSYGIEGMLNGGLTPELSSRLAAKVERSDTGWQRNIVTGDTLGKVNKAAARLAFNWKPSDQIDVLLTGNYSLDKSDTMAGQSIFVYAKGLAAAGVPQSQWTTVGPLLGVPLALFSQAFTPTNARQANWMTKQPVWGGTVGGKNFTPAPVGQLHKDNELKSVALRAEFTLPGGTRFTSLSNYSDFNRDETVDPTGMALEDGLSNQIGYIRSFSQEFRLSGESASTNWIAGLFYANDKLREVDRNWGAVVTDIDPLRVIGSGFLPSGATTAQREDVLWGFRDWQNENNQKITTKAVFGQVEYRFVPDWTLTAGARYTKDNATFAGCSRDQGDNSIAATWNAFFNYYLGIPSNVAPGGCVTYLGDLTNFVTANPSFVPLANPTVFLPRSGVGAFPTQGVVHKDLSEDNVSGRLGLDWHASNDVLVYGYVARGFKSGAFPNVSANVSTQYNPAEQEEIVAIETGIKSRVSGDITLNGATFYYDYKNKQVYGYVPDIVYGTLNRIVNIPKSHIFGAELELALPLTKVLTARANVTYLKTKIDEYKGYDDFGIAHDFAGRSFTFTPELTANAVLSYAFRAGQSWDGEFTLAGRYSGEQQADLLGDSRFKINSYVVADAHLSLMRNGGRYGAELFVKNAFDKYYWSSVQYYEDSLVRFAGMPRTWGLTLKAKY